MFPWTHCVGAGLYNGSERRRGCRVVEEYQADNDWISKTSSRTSRLLSPLYSQLFTHRQAIVRSSQRNKWHKTNEQQKWSFSILHKNSVDGQTRAHPLRLILITQSHILYTQTHPRMALGQFCTRNKTER